MAPMGGTRLKTTDKGTERQKRDKIAENRRTVHTVKGLFLKAEKGTRIVCNPR